MYRYVRFNQKISTPQRLKKSSHLQVLGDSFINKHEPCTPFVSLNFMGISYTLFFLNVKIFSPLHRPIKPSSLRFFNNVESFKFRGTRGRVGCVSLFNTCKTFHYIVTSLYGGKIIGKGNQQNPRLLIPHGLWCFRKSYFFLLWVLPVSYQVLRHC